MEPFVPRVRKAEEAARSSGRIGDAVGSVLVQRHQIPRSRHRQRLEEHRVEQREDRGVGADAESQRRDRGQGKSGRPSQRSRAITHVLHQHIEKCACPHRAHVLLDRLDPAELQRRGATRFRLIQTVLHLLLHEQRVDGPDLVVEVAVDAVPVHDISPEAGDAGFQRHDSLRCSSQPDTQIGSRILLAQASSARAIAMAMRFHCAVSSPSCRRPARVSV